MVVAKTERAYTALKRAFHDREVEKIYHAVVQGHPDPLAGHDRRADRPASRAPTGSSRSPPTASTRSPTTRRSRRSRGASLLEIHLETGRTHQIRVHMAAQRHPCVGDPLYGADPTLVGARSGSTRQWLHAMQLGVRRTRRRGSG